MRARRAQTLTGLAVAAALATSGCGAGFLTEPTGVTASSATLNGVAASTLHGAGTYHFEYGRSTAYGQATPVRAVDFESLPAHPVAETVSGLAPGTVYHYRLCVTDADAGAGTQCSRDGALTSFDPGPATAFAYVLGAPGTLNELALTASGAMRSVVPPIVDTGADDDSAAASPDGRSLYLSRLHQIAQFDIGAGGAATPKTPATVNVGDEGPDLHRRPPERPGALLAPGQRAPPHTDRGGRAPRCARSPRGPDRIPPLGSSSRPMGAGSTPSAETRSGSSGRTPTGG